METARDPMKEWVTLGKGYFTQRDFPRAESYLRKVVAEHTAYADVYHMLGVIHHADGRFASAVEHFQKALKLNPHYTEAILNLAVLYNDLGQYNDAKKLYTQLRKGSTKTPGKKGRGREPQQIEPVLKGRLANLHADVGDIYHGLGLYRHAAEEYRKALALNPTYSDIRTKLGIALREEGHFPESVNELKQACRDSTHYHAAHVQLGVTYYSLGKLAEAKKEWNTVCQKDAKNELARMYLRLCESAPKV